MTNTQTYERLTHAEFDRLLDAYVAAHVVAVRAALYSRDESSAVLKAVEAREALGKAVFP
jgi:hypothetical protein